MCLHYTPGKNNSKAFSQLGSGADESTFAARIAMKQQFWLLFAVEAYKDEVVTVSKGTVLKVIRRAFAVATLPNRLGVVTKINRHTVIKHPQAAFPESIVTICLAILYDTAIDLIYVGKAAFFHHSRYHFAADAARTVGDHFLVLDIIVFVALELGYEVARRIGIWHDRVLELANSCFVFVATVEEHDVITILLHKFVHLLRFEMDSAANHTVLVDIELIVAVFETYQFTARFDAHAGKIVG